MAKDPAFLFYPGDFNTGTQFFSDDQVGKYMRLLMAQHQHGHLSEDQVIFICKSYDKLVMSKFSKDSGGLWFNERLEIEINKRKRFVESRSKNKEGKTKEKIISKSYDNHMENRNENEDLINSNKGEVEKIIFTNDQFIGEMRRMYPGKDLKKAWDQCWVHFSNLPNPLPVWMWRQKLSTWLSNMKVEKNNANKLQL